MSAVLRTLAWAALAAFVAIASPASQAQFAPSPPAAQVAAKDLPKEARETLALVKKGGPFPYAKDGAVFGNREGRLPAAEARLLSRIHGEDARRAHARHAAHRRRAATATTGTPTTTTPPSAGSENEARPCRLTR